MIVFLSPDRLTQRHTGPLLEGMVLHAILTDTYNGFKFWVEDNGKPFIYYKMIRNAQDLRGIQFAELHKTHDAHKMADYQQALEIAAHVVTRH